MLGGRAIGHLYEAALDRLQRQTMVDSDRQRAARERLEHARDSMMHAPTQRAERARWNRREWQDRITHTLRVAVDVAALQAYAATAQADNVPVNKHGQPYWATERVMIERLLRHVHHPTPTARFGTMVIRYWYGKCGSALVDAGLVSTSREMAVPPDWHADPFNLPKRITGLAFAAFEDYDDTKGPTLMHEL